MSCVSELSQSNEYLSFRSSIPLRKIVVDSDGSKVNKLDQTLSIRMNNFVQSCWLPDLLYTRHLSFAHCFYDN